MAKFDLTGLRLQIGSKVRYIDNCEVVDAGSGAMPRTVEVRLPGADGARLLALNNVLPALTTSDTVRISVSNTKEIAYIEGIGSDSAGGGLDSFEVSKLVASDGAPDPALSADATGNISTAYNMVVGATSFAANRVFEVVKDGENSHVSLASFGSVAARRGIFDFLKARGSLTSPSSPSSGDDIGQLRFRGYDSSLAGYGTVADIRIQTDGSMTGLLNSPGRIVFNIGTTSGSTEVMRIISSARVGIIETSPSGKLSVKQDSTTGAIPVASFEQSDISEEFLRFIGSAASATLTQSIVNEADVTTATKQGWLKVYVQDDGNQITDQAYFIPIFTLA